MHPVKLSEGGYTTTTITTITTTIITIFRTTVITIVPRSPSPPLSPPPSPAPPIPSPPQPSSPPSSLSPHHPPHHHLHHHHFHYHDHHHHHHLHHHHCHYHCHFASHPEACKRKQFCQVWPTQATGGKLCCKGLQGQHWACLAHCCIPRTLPDVWHRAGVKGRPGAGSRDLMLHRCLSVRTSCLCSWVPGSAQLCLLISQSLLWGNLTACPGPDALNLSLCLQTLQENSDLCKCAQQKDSLVHTLCTQQMPGPATSMRTLSPSQQGSLSSSLKFLLPQMLPAALSGQPVPLWPQDRVAFLIWAGHTARASWMGLAHWKERVAILAHTGCLGFPG